MSTVTVIPEGIGGAGGQIVCPHPSNIPTRPVWGLARTDPITCVKGHTIRPGHRVYVTADRLPVCEKCAGRGVYAIEYREVIRRHEV